MQLDYFYNNDNSNKNNSLLKTHSPLITHPSHSPEPTVFELHWGLPLRSCGWWGGDSGLLHSPSLIHTHNHSLMHTHTHFSHAHSPPPQHVSHTLMCSCPNTLPQFYVTSSGPLSGFFPNTVWLGGDRAGFWINAPRFILSCWQNYLRAHQAEGEMLIMFFW